MPLAHSYCRGIAWLAHNELDGSTLRNRDRYGITQLSFNQEENHVAQIKLAAGVLFLVFAGWTLWGKSGTCEEGEVDTPLKSPLTVAGAFFMAELGDKTQLAALTLAARYQAFWPVWLGASAGMIMAITLAVGVGYFVGRNIPDKALKWFSAGIFGIFGIVTIITALGLF